VHGTQLLADIPQSANRPYVAVNFVSTVDGRAVVNGSAAGLGSPTDQILMRRLRAEADALLHGAGTLRADRFKPSVPDDLADQRVRRGLSRQPMGALVTVRGLIPEGHPYLTSATPEWPRLIYTSTESVNAFARPGVEVVQQPGDAPDLRAVLSDLFRRGVRRVVCEGGPTLNRFLLAANLVDELFLTLAPRLAGGPDPITIVHGERIGNVPLAIRSAYARDSELFLRYTVGQPIPAGA
jgi:5-amino-6-(5-phosphoribosylamino)uracil reductase